MKTIKVVGNILGAFLLLFAFNFPRIAFLFALAWMCIGIITCILFLRCRGKELVKWTTADTVVCAVFAVFGPLGLWAVRSNDPRL
jgi:hypothetical protein